MKKRWGFWLFGLTAVLFVFAGTSRAGVIVADSNGNKTYVSNGKMKSLSDGNSQTIIFDTNRELLIFIDNDKKTYSQGTIDELCQETVSAMDAAMEGMSEEEKAMMKQFMGKMGQKEPQPPPTVTVTKEGSGGKIAGLKTTKYLVKVNGKLYEEIWISNDSVLMDEFKKMSKMVDMSSKMAGCMGGPMSQSYSSAPESSKKYLELLKKGYPLKVISHEEGAPEKETVIEVKKQSIPDSEFLPPKGYKELPLKTFMGGNR